MFQLLTKGLSTKIIFLGLALFLGILLFVILIVLNLGKNYEGGLSSIRASKPQEYTLTKKKNIKRIRIKRDTSNDCIEVTPDGVVRVFEDCSTEASGAHRLSDTKNIQRLFKLITEKDTLINQMPGVGRAYELTIESDEGTETIIIWVSDDAEDDGDDIIDTIDDILEEVPLPSPSAVPSASGGSSNTPGVSPTPGASTGFASPQPTPSIQPSPQPFTCGFSQGQPGKPFAVSNIICSDQPQPGE